MSSRIRKLFGNDDKPKLTCPDPFKLIADIKIAMGERDTVLKISLCRILMDAQTLFKIRLGDLQNLSRFTSKTPEELSELEKKALLSCCCVSELVNRTFLLENSPDQVSEPWRGKVALAFVRHGVPFPPPQLTL